MQTVYINQIPGGYSKAWQGATVNLRRALRVDQTSGHTHGHQQQWAVRTL